MRRNRPGTKSVDLWNWEEEKFECMDGPFAVQEYIQQLIRSNPSNVAKICEPPKDIDIYVWQYEHLRQFILELNLLIVQLQGVCTSKVCPKMRITDEWLFLCACHTPPQECSAIDYMIHTLDNSCSILNDTKYFGSRVSIPQSSSKHITMIGRRLYRLFAHTYFNHKVTFQEFEKEMHLCERFTYFVRKFDLMQKKDLIIGAYDKPTDK